VRRSTTTSWVLPHRDGRWADRAIGVAESLAEAALREPIELAFPQLTQSLGQPESFWGRLDVRHRHDASMNRTGQSIA
jgi:hypothetical protein